MSADFSSHRLFARDDGCRLRRAAVDEVRRYFRQNGLREVTNEDEAVRSVVVGPPGRWILIGDSAGSTEWSDPLGFDSLALVLSTLGPVIDTKMSDDAAVHFYLYRDGRLVDKFGNAAFPFFRFGSDEEARPFRGHPELWADLLVDPDAVPALRGAWVQEWQARETLTTTGQLFGWEPALLWVGDTYDDEGLPVKYDEFLSDTAVDLSGFEELHFA